MYDPIIIANYFINKGIEEDQQVTPMQVLKLVYISYGWYIGLSGNLLFEEKVEAWTYGPVVPSVYYRFKAYGRNTIDKPSEEGGRIDDEETAKFLDKIWSKYSSLSGLQLSELTHRDDTPWKKAINRNSKYIDPNQVREHYRKLAGIDEAA
jgi:uncharacterized phage-associated protein